MTETHHSSQPRQTYHHGHLHEVLVKKGLEMARSGGTEAVVLREATRRAGVSPNAAYRHFANREALLDEVGLAAADQIGVVMREAVAEAQPIDDESVAVSQLVAACRAYLDFALTEVTLSDRVDVRSLVILLWSVLHGFASLSTSGPLRGEKTPEWADRVLDVIRASLRGAIARA